MVIEFTGEICTMVMGMIPRSYLDIRVENTAKTTWIKHGLIILYMDY